jgi:prepilin signal peptidase PulO-like enzyme (type II secretory pathway)
MFSERPYLSGVVPHTQGAFAQHGVFLFTCQQVSAYFSPVYNLFVLFWLFLLPYVYFHFFAFHKLIAMYVLVSGIRITWR